MDGPESSGTPPHPPPTLMETRTCHECGGEGYVPLDVDYRPDTGQLMTVGGLCVACRGQGELVVYLYRGGGA